MQADESPPPQQVHRPPTRHLDQLQLLLNLKQLKIVLNSKDTSTSRSGLFLLAANACFYRQGLWQPCFDKVCECRFPSCICSLPVSVSHLVTLAIFLNFFILAVSVMMVCGQCLWCHSDNGFRAPGTSIYGELNWWVLCVFWLLRWPAVPHLCPSLGASLSRDTNNTEMKSVNIPTTASKCSSKRKKSCHSL